MSDLVSNKYNVFDDEKMKGKVDEPNLRLELGRSLGLKISNNEVNPKTNLKLELFNGLNTRSCTNKVPEEYSVKKRDAETQRFHCKFCNKKFSNSQALGGHQNAHKRERAARFDKTMAPNLPYPTAMLGLSNHRLPLHRSHALGINMHSMIHKPYNSMSHLRHASAGYTPYEGWSSSPIFTSPQVPFYAADNYWPWFSNSGHQPSENTGYSGKVPLACIPRSTTPFGNPTPTTTQKTTGGGSLSRDGYYNS